MIALYVILGLLFLLFLIGQIRLGALAEYGEDGLVVKLKVAAFWFTVYPKPEKPKKKTRRKAKEEKTPEQEEKPKQKKGGTLSLLLELLPVAVEAVGGLIRRIRMDVLELQLIWAAEDPASAAIGYGAANAAVGMIYQPLDRVFRIKKSDIDISVDYEQKEPVVCGRAILTITVGQIVTLVVRYGYRTLKILKERRKNQPDTNTKKEAKAHE